MEFCQVLAHPSYRDAPLQEGYQNLAACSCSDLAVAALPSSHGFSSQELPRSIKKKSPLDHWWGRGRLARTPRGSTPPWC